MRVVSWNIDARGDGLKGRIEQLSAFDADILLLQEVPRRVAPLLAAVAGVAWAELSVLHSEPTGGSSARLGTAILASDRVQLTEVGQIPEQRFIDAGVRAGLSESEVRQRTGWLHRNLYADVEIDGIALRVCSLHARPATGGVPGRPPLGYTRQVFHRVCAAWLAEHDGTTLFGIDANGPFIDHPDPERWRLAMAGDATLIGPRPVHHMTDAMYHWLASRPDQMEAIRRSRQRRTARRVIRDDRIQPSVPLRPRVRNRRHRCRRHPVPLAPPRRFRPRRSGNHPRHPKTVMMRGCGEGRLRP